MFRISGWSVFISQLLSHARIFGNHFVWRPASRPTSAAEKAQSPYRHRILSAWTQNQYKQAGLPIR